MDTTTIQTIALGFVAVWGAAVMIFAFLNASRRAFDPPAAELPEHHDDHGAHGHHEAHDHHDAHGHH